jgi:hypothetical protein
MKDGLRIEQELEKLIQYIGELEFKYLDLDVQVIKQNIKKNNGALFLVNDILGLEKYDDENLEIGKEGLISIINNIRREVVQPVDIAVSKEMRKLTDKAINDYWKADDECFMALSLLLGSKQYVDGERKFIGLKGLVELLEKEVSRIKEIQKDKLLSLPTSKKIEIVERAVRSERKAKAKGKGDASTVG